jgi:hypothetical protein
MVYLPNYAAKRAPMLRGFSPMSDPASLNVFASASISMSSTQGLSIALVCLMAWPLAIITVMTGIKLILVQRIRNRFRFVYSGGRSREPGEVREPILHGHSLGVVGLRPARPHR